MVEELFIVKKYEVNKYVQFCKNTIYFCLKKLLLK